MISVAVSPASGARGAKTSSLHRSGPPAGSSTRSQSWEADDAVPEVAPAGFGPWPRPVPTFDSPSSPSPVSGSGETSKSADDAGAVPPANTTNAPAERPETPPPRPGPGQQRRSISRSISNSVPHRSSKPSHSASRPAPAPAPSTPPSRRRYDGYSNYTYTSRRTTATPGSPSASDLHHPQTPGPYHALSLLSPRSEDGPSSLSPPELPSPMSLHHLGFSSPSSPSSSLLLSPLQRDFPFSPLAPSSSGDGRGGGEDQDEVDDELSDSIDDDEFDGGGGHDEEGTDHSQLLEDPRDIDPSLSLDTAEDPGALVADDELTQDSRDVLVERLTDLAQRLSVAGTGSGGGFREGDVTALHAKVDEMERVLALALAGRQPAQAPRRPRKDPPPALGSPLMLARAGSAPRQHRRGESWSSSSTTTPNWLAHRLSGSFSPPLERRIVAFPGPEKGPDLPSATATALPKTPTTIVQVEEQVAEETGLTGAVPAKISNDVASHLVVEAEKLCAELTGVLESLQARREESDHLHEMLLDRAEGAAERILELEAEVKELKEEIRGNESELRNLGIQLKALEVLCDSMVTEDTDPELLQSIRNWRLDWRNLKHKMAENKRTRRNRDGDGDGDVSISTIVSP